MQRYSSVKNHHRTITSILAPVRYGYTSIRTPPPASTHKCYPTINSILRPRITPGEAAKKSSWGRLSSSGGSATLKKLIELVGNGSSHVSTASEIARAVEQDVGTIPSGLKKLAGCGAHGACAANTERDFQRMIKADYSFPLEPYIVRLSLEDPGLT